MNKELWKINESLKDVESKLSGIKKVLKESDDKEKERLGDVVKATKSLKKKNRDGEIVEAIKNIPQTKFPKTQKVEVENQVKEIKVKKPSWYKSFKLSKDIFDPLLGAIGSLVNRIFKVNVENLPNKPKEYISVRLTDGKFFTGIPSGGGGGPKIVGVKNASDVRINPATSDNQINGNQTTKITDIDGNSQGLLIHDNVLGVVKSGHLMAEGLIAGHQTLFKIGYNPNVGTTEETVWSGGGTYVFPTAEQQMEVVSTDNTDDIGVVIKGDATGNTVQSDADGTTTTIEDDDVDFTSATAVAVGDCVILDPHGTQPEFGTVTAVDTHTLTVAGGFNKGGSGASRYYAVVDGSANAGATVVQFGYLDGDYVRHREIVVLNGTTPVNTVNTDIYRINGVNVVCAGSGGVPTGNISLRNTAGTIEYGHITAGYTISRQAVFTIPAGITGYLVSANISASDPNDSKVQSCRVIIRSNTTPDEDFKSSLFFPKAEFDITNSAENISFEIPLKFVEKSDFIVSAQGFTGFVGPVVGVFRGYLVQNE